MTRFFSVTCLFCLALFASSCLSFDSNPYKQGKNLYEANCQNCHQEDGKALRGLIPPLAGSDFLEKNQSVIPCIIQNGLNQEISVNGETFNQPMPAITTLTPIQIANIINYVNNAWGNKAEYVSYDDVVKALEDCGTTRNWNQFK